MAIQNRRGDYANFDPQKMKPGEFAIVQSNDPNASDGKAVYICTQAGTVKRLVSDLEVYDEVQNAATEIAQEIHEAVDEDVQRAETAAESAEQSAASLEIDNTLTEHNKVPESYAAGRIVVVGDDEPTDVSNKVWIKDNIDEIEIPTMDDIRTLVSTIGSAMLTCFKHVIWDNEYGQYYYEALVEALNTEIEPTPEPTPQPVLPTGYTEYDYIKINNLDTMSGGIGLIRTNQIILPFTGDKNMHIYDFTVGDMPPTESRPVFGGRDVDGSSDSLALYIQPDTDTMAFHAHGETSGNLTMTGIWNSGSKWRVIFNPSVNPTILNINGLTITRAWNSNSQATEAQIALFGNPAPSASNYIYNIPNTLKIGRFKVYNTSNNLVCDCIPCSNSTGKFGMYDVISETLVTSAADNTYICGNCN